MKLLVKGLIVIALLGIIYVFTDFFIKKQRYVNESNTGIEKVNSGKNGDASVYFEQMLIKYADNPDKCSEIKNNLLISYRNLADDPSYDILQKQAILQKIEELDPSALTEIDKKILKHTPQ